MALDSTNEPAEQVAPTTDDPSQLAAPDAGGEGPPTGEQIAPALDDSHEVLQTAAGEAPAQQPDAGGNGGGDPTKPKPLLSRIAGGIKDIVTHPIEDVKAAARGAVDAASGAARTTVELSTAFLGKTGLGKLIGGDEWQSAYDQLGAKGFGAIAAHPLDEANDTIFGPESARGGQQFIEGTSQFLTGFFAAGAAVPALRGAGVAKAILKGAVSDFAAIDPYQQNLAELAASTKIPGIHHLGDILTVEGDDGPAVARFKRAAAGSIAGSAVEGLVASARLLRNLRTVQSGTATAAEKLVAAQAVDENQTILKNVQNGTHVPADPVVAKRTPQGTYTLEVNPEHPAIADVPPEPPPSSPETIDKALNGELPRAVVDDNGVVHTAPAPNMSHAEVMADAQRTKQAPFDNFTPAQRGWIDNQNGRFLGAKEVGDVVSSPEYSARWQAEQQAATISATIEKKAAGALPVSPADVEEVANGTRDILSAETPEAMADKLRSTRFNFSYIDGDERTKALLKTAADHFGAVFDDAQGRPTITQEATLQRAMDLAGVIQPENADEFVKNFSTTLQHADAGVLAAHAHMMSIGDDLAKLSGIIDQRPWDAVAHDQARSGLARFLSVASDVAGANSGLGRALNALKFRGAQQLRGLKFGGQDVADATKAGTATDPVKSMLDALSDQDIRDGLRITRMTNQPADLAEVLSKHFLPHPEDFFSSAQAEHDALPTGTKISAGVQEAFYGTLLNNPATAAAVFLGTGTTTAMENAVHMMAGIAKRDPVMIRQATDLLMGHMIYLKQSLIGIAAGFKAGHSIIDPHPVVKAIPGIAGEAIRTFGARPIQAMDEFWRVNNILAYTRMQSLSIAREDAARMNLQGPELDKFLHSRVTTDVANSLDDQGRSIYPAARQYAQLPAFAAKLEPGSFSGDLQKFIRDHPIITPVAPFVKVTANSMSYAFQKMTPLGLLTKNWAQATGQEAALIGTRMAVGSTVWGAAAMYAFSDNMTGNGPTDPSLRQAWLKDHQPYSFKVGGEWMSYRRLEPFSTPLSLAADIMHMVRDNSDDLSVTNDAAPIYYGLVAASLSALTNKTYLSGLVDLMNAVGSGDKSAVASYMKRQTASVVPGILSAFNSDPYMRQVTTMTDAIKDKVPGWSRSLPAKYDVFGDPRVMKPSREMHSLDPVATQAITDTPEESQFLAMGKAFDPPPTVQRFGQISVNLHDKQWRNSDGSDATPYERLMEIVREDDLRGQVNSVISDPSFKDLGDGTAVFKGGRQYEAIRNVIQREYERATRRMYGEYPELNAITKGLTRATKASRRSDVGANNILDQLHQQ